RRPRARRSAPRRQPERETRPPRRPATRAGPTPCRRRLSFESLLWIATAARNDPTDSSGGRLYTPGRVAERFKAPVLKTGDGQPSVGSNPTSSAASIGRRTVERLATAPDPPAAR